MKQQWRHKVIKGFSILTFDLPNPGPQASEHQQLSAAASQRGVFPHLSSFHRQLATTHGPLHLTHISLEA